MLYGCCAAGGRGYQTRSEPRELDAPQPRERKRQLGPRPPTLDGSQVLRCLTVSRTVPLLLPWTLFGANLPLPTPLPLPHSHSPSLSSFLLPQAAPASLACSRRRLELLHFTLLLLCAHTEKHALVGHRTRLYLIHVLIIDIFSLISTSPAKNNRPAPAARQTSPPSYRAPRSLNLPPHDETTCLPPNSSTAERFSTSTLRFRF